MKYILIALLVSLTACSSVTIQPKATLKRQSPPTAASTQHFFLWGLLPTERNVDVSQVCGGNTPTQIQARDTFVDRLLNFVTLGLYAPRTAKVWCS